MCINHSDFIGNLNEVAHTWLHQICDLTTYKGAEFGYFGKRNEIALFFATNSYTRPLEVISPY